MTSALSVSVSSAACAAAPVPLRLARPNSAGRQARAEGGRYPVSGAQHGQPEHDFVLQSGFSTRDDGGWTIVERRRKDVSV